MPSFSASSFANGTAYTSTTPSSLVTATATATATSNVSQQDAQNIADATAQNQANAAAQNDANIISQTLALSSSSLKGQFSSLSLYEGISSECNSGSASVPSGYPPYLAGISGVIVNNNSSQSEVSEPNSLVVTVKKPIYKINSLESTQSYPTEIITTGAYLTASYALTYQNFGVTSTITYEDTDAPTIFGSFHSLPQTTQTALSSRGSFLQGQRTSYKYTPNLNDVDYNIVVVTNVAILCSEQIPTSFPDDTALQTFITKLNKGGFVQMTFLNKMAQSISTYQISTQTYKKFDGINMSQTISSPTVGSQNWNYIYSDFTNATLGGSSNSITYPIQLFTTSAP